MAKNREKSGLLVKFIGVLATASCILFVIKGLVPLYDMRQKVKTKAEEVTWLVEENRALAEEIGRLKHDPRYIERVVREDYGLARDDEVIYRFGTDGR
jgi:cell division protein FtsB